MSGAGIEAMKRLFHIGAAIDVNLKFAFTFKVYFYKYKKQAAVPIHQPSM